MTLCKTCRECWVDSDHLRKNQPLWRFCVSDEHYVPTLLASRGLDNETDCLVGALCSVHHLAIRIHVVSVLHSTPRNATWIACMNALSGTFLGGHWFHGACFLHNASPDSLSQFAQGSSTNAWWDGPYFHPRTWAEADVNLELIEKLRKTDHGFVPREGEVACPANLVLHAPPGSAAALLSLHWLLARLWYQKHKCMACTQAAVLLWVLHLMAWCQGTWRLPQLEPKTSN